MRDIFLRNMIPRKEFYLIYVLIDLHSTLLSDDRVL